MIMAMEMAELEVLLGIHPMTLTDLDVAAAQQLVRLSGEDYSNNNNNQKKRRRKNRNKGDFEDEEEEFDRRSQNEITSKTIEEVFRKEEEVARPRKKRYRSLVSVYQAPRIVLIDKETRMMMKLPFLRF